MSSNVTVETALREPERSHFSGSIKLQDHHRARTAIVYVRQSSMHQVQENTESTERQYALVHRACARLGGGLCGGDRRRPGA